MSQEMKYGTSLIVLGAAFMAGRISQNMTDEKSSEEFIPQMDVMMRSAKEIQPNEFLVPGIENSWKGTLLTTDQIISSFERTHKNLKVMGVLTASRLKEIDPEMTKEPGSLVFFVTPNNKR